MLRKFCLLVIILILVSGSACAADLRLEMQFIIHQKDSESAVTAETLIREHEIMLISGLFPSYAFSIDSEQASLPELTDTTFDLFTLPEATEIIPAFLQILNAETYEGVFAGDLFDNANLAAKGCISAADLLSLFAGHIRTETEQKKNEIDLNTANKIINYTYFPSISFVIGTIGVSIYKSLKIGFILWLI